MAPIKLTCPAGAPCQYITEEVELEAAMELLTMHRDIAHAALVQPQQGKKPEKGKMGQSHPKAPPRTAPVRTEKCKTSEQGALDKPTPYSQPEFSLQVNKLEKPKHEIISGNGEENDGSAWTDIDGSLIWKDICNFRRNKFRVGDFLQNLFLGFGLSAWDIVSDFRFAKTLETDGVDLFDNIPGSAHLSLLFIALPGALFVTTPLQHILEKCIKQRNWTEKKKKLVSNGCSLFSVVVIGGGLVSLMGWTGSMVGDPTLPLLICKILAISVATCLLSIKALGVFIHTDNVRKLSLKASNYESSYESSLQLLLIMFLWLRSREHELDHMAMASSLVVIAKSGAENFLTFGEENKLPREKGFLSKLMILAKFIPVFLLTGFFRVGTLAVCAYWDHVVMLGVLLPLALVLPLIVVLLIEQRGDLPHLTLTEIVEGLVGEMTGIVLWGRTGRERSRKKQLWIGSYLLLLYTGILALVMATIGSPSPIYGAKTTKLALYLAVSLLTSGWIGYALFIFQVYLFSRYNMDLMK